MSAPAVTVLMGVYNGEAYLREAVDSILAQTYRDFELLVIDDGSTDATPEILASYGDERLRVVANEENIGLTRSLNRGLRLARGRFVARQDADDYSYPARLARQVAFLDAHPDAALLGTQFVAIDARGRRRPINLWMRSQTSLGIRFQSLFGNPFVHSSVMFRRDVVLDRYGGYDESFRTNQDFELWSRMIPNERLHNLAEPLVALRQRTGSISDNYGLEAVRKVIAVLVKNQRALLGSDPTVDAATEVLARAFNPRLFPPVRSLGPLADFIDRAYERFVERWPEALNIHEIRVVAASVIAVTATACATTAPLAMSRWYLEAARYHVPTFARGAVRFAATGALGRLRRRPESRQEKK